MKVLISSASLDLSGVPTYTLTLYEELVRLGVHVDVYSPDKKGHLYSVMHASDNPASFSVPDVILGQHRDCVRLLRDVFSDVPLVFMAHGVLPDGEQPPRLLIQHYTAINEDGVTNLVRQHVDPDKISILRDFVDTVKYSPRSPINETPQRIIYVSNYRKGYTWEVIAGACERLGIEFRAVGAPYGRERDMATAINNADIVVSSGRAILEGMACGRAVISWETGYGDGYITPNLYYESRTRNFGGRYCYHNLDVDSMVEEIKKYRQFHGLNNRGLVMSYHSHEKGVQQVLKIIERIV